MTSPEVAPNAWWQLDMWFNESLHAVSNKTRDSLRAYFLVGAQEHALDLLHEACQAYADVDNLSFIDIDLSDMSVTPENLHKSLGIRSQRYHKAKLAVDRKCVLFRNLNRSTPEFREAIVGLAKNRKCGPLYFPSNWMAFVHMDSEESIVDLLPVKLLLDACWIPVTEETDVGTTDIQDVMDVHIEKTKDAGRHYGPRIPKN